MSPAWIVVAATLGLLLGPVLRGQILRHSVEPDQPWRQHCAHCGRRLLAAGWRGLVGAVPASGRCPHCGRRIGPAAGAVEAMAAAVLALLAWRVDEPLPLLALGWTFLVGVALGFVDAAVHRLPDRLTMAAAGGGIALLGVDALVDQRPGRLGLAVACAVAVAGCYLVLVIVNPSGMGLGDSKAGLATGLVTGWYGWVAAVAGAAVGFVFAGVYALAMLLSGRAGPKDEIPHGPFMLLGALATVVLLHR